MLSRVAAAAALALGALLAQPAQAGSVGFGFSIQSGPGWYDAGPRYAPYPPGYYAPALLSPRQVERLLYRSGYSSLQVVALRGQIYIVQGIDPWHNVVEMQVSGYDGQVLYTEVIPARLYDSPFGHQPQLAVPDRRQRPVVRDQRPRVVGAIPQSPPAMRGRSQPQVVTAPLPRSRPAFQPQMDEPARSAEPAPLPDLPEERPGGRDPLVVY